MEYLVLGIIILIGFVAIIFIITGITNLITLIPYIPSKYKYVEDIFINLKKEFKNKKGLKVYDLGAGDGRVLFLAEKYGFDAEGYENSLAPFLWAYFKRILTKSKIKIKFSSFFKADLKDADIIFVYLMPFILPRLVKKIQNECKKGTLIISSGFEVKDLKAFKISPRIKEKNWPAIYYYSV